MLPGLGWVGTAPGWSGCFEKSWPKSVSGSDCWWGITVAALLVTYYMQSVCSKSSMQYSRQLWRCLQLLRYCCQWQCSSWLSPRKCPSRHILYHSSVRTCAPVNQKRFSWLFTARRCASAVLATAIPSVCPSVTRRYCPYWVLVVNKWSRSVCQCASFYSYPVLFITE